MRVLLIIIVFIPLVFIIFPQLNMHVFLLKFVIGIKLK